MAHAAFAVSHRHYARIAGLLDLVIAVVGAFAIAYAPSVIVVAGDARGTASNLLAHPDLARPGVLAEGVVIAVNLPIHLIPDVRPSSAGGAGGPGGVVPEPAAPVTA